MNPKYPLYIPSKGRWESRLTSKSLEKMGVPYHIIVEQQEYDEYAKVINPDKILILDKKYQDNYDTFDDLGASLGKGSGPARNFIWDHSIKMGYKFHWIMDDNIRDFFRYHNNRKIRVGDGVFFKVMEDFVERYDNIAMAGPNYFMFVPRKEKKAPVTFNTRIYSCNLIRNDVPYRWRGRYNEDTDLSLRMLKDGWCTVLFNTFLQGKSATLTIKGGNTNTIYSNGTNEKSKMIVRMHPDVARLSYRFHRCHHYVDYTPFKKNKLKLKENIVIPDKVNEYGMQLVDIRE